MGQWDCDLQRFFPNIGFSELKPLQSQIISNVVNSGNTLGIMQTGGGKSLIYWMAGLELGGISIVISPLISLIAEQTEKLREQGYEVLELRGGIDALKQMKLLKDFADKKLNPDFIFLSPEKIAIDGLLEECFKIRKDDIKLLVIDEVHCVSQWGMSFRPFYQRIPNFMDSVFGSTKDWCRILALTATVNNQELKDICSYFNIEKQNIIRQPLMMRSEIQLHTMKCQNEDDKDTKFWETLERHNGEKTLVYVYRKYKKHSVESLCEEANRKGYKAAAFHGDMNAKERQQIVDKFKHNELTVVFATNAFGMGIDIPDIRVVMHYMIPESGEQYYQEIGRAARDGKSANAYLFYTDKNIDVKSEYFIDHSFPSENLLKETYKKLLPMGNSIYSSFHLYDDEEIVKCIPYYIQTGLIEIICKGIGSLSGLKDIKDNKLQELYDATKMHLFLATSQKKNISPEELATLIFEDYLHNKADLSKALDKSLILKINEKEITDSVMNQMLESIEEKKMYKHELLNFFVFQVSQCKNSQELHQEIAYYLGTDKHQLNKIYQTIDGNMVRSKSEVIICNLLHESGIKYEYEKKLFYEGKNYIEPDFTIPLPNGSEIYWEHVGMLGLESYDENWSKKLKIYNKHFNGQMIKTYESGVLSKEAEEKIEYLKGLL